jgi:tetratricopeptide (TPR) repeat protein
VNLSRAQRLSPGNPRVLLIDGMNMLYRPKAFGGGAAPALEIFVAARDAFASDAPADSTAPDWGRDDAYAWLGRAYSALQKTDEARAAYEMALELNPKNGWVKKVLLPGLEKQPAKGAGQ